MTGTAAAARPHLIPIDEIVRRLTDRIDELCAVLLPLGRRHGHEWQEAASRAGGLGDSLSVRLTEPRKGVWSHFGASRGGDALDLIAYVKTHGDKAGAIRWAKDFLGIGDGEGWKPDAQAEARARKAREDAAQKAERDSNWRTRQARRLWLSAPALEPGDVVDRYLCSRAIGLLQLGKRPGCLRAGQSITHRDGSRWPAMLAAVVGPDGQTVAVHRTWLTPDGGKAPVDPVKMVLGDYRGASIPLWKGVHKQTLRQLPDGVPVYIAEGIEDGLSVARLLPEARVLVAISVSNFGAIWLPEQVGEVTIVGQNDPETMPDGRPHPAREAIARAIDVHARKGRTVKLARPPLPHKDFNDWLRS